MEWLMIVVAAVLGGGGLSWLTVYVATRKRDSASDIAARFDDASELAKYIDERVEAKVKPIRDRLAEVEAESHELQNAFREWVSGVWLWNRNGRAGDLPMPPVKILSRLGLGHFVSEWPTEPKQPR